MSDHRKAHERFHAFIFIATLTAGLAFFGLLIYLTENGTTYVPAP